MLLAVFVVIPNTLKVKANVSALTVVPVTNTSRPGFSGATTTPNYLVPGTALATTTQYFYTEYSDFRQVEVMQIGSSSSATLGIRAAFSSDLNCNATANCNWYEEEGPALVFGVSNGTQLNNIDIASSTVTRRWNSATTTANPLVNWAFKTIKLPDTPARYMRLQFFAIPGGTNLSFTAQVVLKSVNNQ